MVISKTGTYIVARIGLASVLLTINWTTYVWAVVNKHVLEVALGYFIAPVFTIVVGVFVLQLLGQHSFYLVQRDRRRARME
jgi:RarD protein